VIAAVMRHRLECGFYVRSVSAPKAASARSKLGRRRTTLINPEPALPPGALVRRRSLTQ